MATPTIVRWAGLTLLSIACVSVAERARALTRCEVIADAQSWVDAQVPYCQGPGGYYCTACDPCYYDPLRGGQCYRSDCSGYVSATWGLAAPGPATGGLCDTGQPISFDALEPGDALVACADHAMLFAGWTVPGVRFNAYEETTCGGVAHLAEHDRYSDGYWGNMEASFYALRLPGIEACPPPDAAPIGWLDGASCDKIAGWSQDPDAPDAPIDVHVYLGGPAGSGAPAVALHADLQRDDLCTAIGSCAHGYALAPPLSLFDGQPHEVHAYGISVPGPNNAELSGSPQSLSCAPMIPSGVRRHVINPDSFAAWKFDELWDTLPAGDEAIAALPSGDDVPATPELVQADDGTPEVWVKDGTRRRHVTSPDAMGAWRFDWNGIAKLPASEVYALELGPDWRARPVLLHQSDGTIYLVDEPPPKPDQPTGSGGTSDTAGSGGSGGSGAAVAGSGSAAGTTNGTSRGAAMPDDALNGGCACSVPTRGGDRMTGFFAIAAALSILVTRRRRPSRARLAPIGCMIAAAACAGCSGGSLGERERVATEQQPIHYSHAGPGPWPHVLTCYGGPSDSSAYGHATSCGPIADGSWWYATERAAFYCGARLELTRGDKCVVVDVEDNGPADWVEGNSAATCGVGYIIDASPLVANYFGGGCGWSECFVVNVRQVADSTPTGPCAPADAPPVGWLDSASCDAIAGWSQDPDAPDASIDVHVYMGGPAGSGAPAVAVHADVPRDDLCAAIGSCAHGYALAPPLSLFDAQPHEVHVYGISVPGPNNAELSGSPQALSCPPTIPSGVRRHVINPDSFAAWKLDEFWDTLPAGDTQIAELSPGEDLPAAPELVQADDGTPEVWIRDGAYRRHIPNPAAMQAWRFDWNAIAKQPAAEVYALELGPDWRARPVLLHQSDGTIYVVDDPPSEPGPGPNSGSGGSGAGSAGTGPSGAAGGGHAASAGATDSTYRGEAIATDEGGCSIAGSRHENRKFPMALLVASVLGLARKRFWSRLARKSGTSHAARLRALLMDTRTRLRAG